MECRQLLEAEWQGNKLSQSRASLVVQRVKRLPTMWETRVRIPGSRRSPGEGNGDALQYSCLENPTDRRAWRATVHGVAESDMTDWLNSQIQFDKTDSRSPPRCGNLQAASPWDCPRLQTANSARQIFETESLPCDVVTIKLLQKGPSVLQCVIVSMQCSQALYKCWLHSLPFSCSVASDSLRTSGPQYTRPSCPSPTPGVYSNSGASSHPTISSSVVPFSSGLQSFPALGFFPMSQFFSSGGQNIGVSASASVLPVNSQDWSPLGWTGWISLQSKGLS